MKFRIASGIIVLGLLAIYAAAQNYLRTEPLAQRICSLTKGASASKVLELLGPPEYEKVFKASYCMRISERVEKDSTPNPFEWQYASRPPKVLDFSVNPLRVRFLYKRLDCVLFFDSSSNLTEMIYYPF